jgi:amino acid adenylation domain-containing protein
MMRYEELTSQQMRIYWLSAKAKLSPLFNLCFTIEFDSGLNEGFFKEALQLLTRRHDAFGIKLCWMDGILVQAFHDQHDLNYQYLSPGEYGQTEEDVHRWVEEEAGRVFPVLDAPLYRFSLLNRNESGYLFCLHIHHLIADGMSVTFLRRELLDIYCSILEGNRTAIESLPPGTAYRSYVRNQLSFEGSADYLQKEEYWRSSGLKHSSIDFLADYGRQNTKLFQGKTQRGSISKQLLQGLKKCSLQQRVPLSAVLLTGLFVLLHKYGSPDYMNIGFVSNGRQTLAPGDKKAIGLYSVLFPVQAELLKDQSLAGILRQVHQKIGEGIEHQEVALDRIVEMLQISRDFSQQPLFQTVFNMQDRVQPIRELALKETSCNKVDLHISQYELTLHVYMDKDEADIEFEYEASLFHDYKMSQLCRHYLRVLEQLAYRINLPLSETDILEAADHALIRSFSEGSTVEIAEESITEVVRKNLLKWPDKVIIKDAREAYTLKQVNNRAKVIASELLEADFHQGDVVAVLLDRCADLAASMLGIMMLSGVYLPIDCNWPAERIAAVLNDSGAVLVVTAKGEAERSKTVLHGRKTVVIDNSPDKIYGTARLPLTTGKEKGKYLIYTSGSTGIPKGVLLGQKGIVNLCSFFTRELKVTEHDNIIQFFGAGFDASVWEMLMCLATGACMTIVPDKVRLDYAKFAEWIKRDRITVATLPPSYLPFLEPEQVPSLRLLIAAGEASEYAEVKRWKERLTYINAYGPTEATICSSWWTAGEMDHHQVPIGKPLPNVQIRVTDDRGRDVPIGVEGEIVISGSGVALGYLNREALTKDRFILDPEAAASDFLYKTGDRGEWDWNGNLLYMGRNDDQFKVRGFRIEPGEIEYALAQHACVKKAVVIKHRSDTDESLLAYYTGTGVVDEAELREFLLDKLPGYMIPERYISLESFPLTASCKINKAALPRPVKEVIESGHAPGNDLECRIRALWERVLAGNHFTDDRNFFEAGGSSLKIMSLHNLMNAEFNHEFELEDFFKYPTIRAFAQHLSRMEIAVH